MSLAEVQGVFCRGGAKSAEVVFSRRRKERGEVFLEKNGTRYRL